MTTDAGTTAEQTTETDPLLASKLAVPPAPPFTVERERVMDLLSRAVHNPMTVVTGPPGSGKTQLAASWVASGAPPGPVVWITLETGDDDPGVFWPYLVAGLRRSGISLSPAIDQAVHGGTFDRTLLARLAADIAACRYPVVLVLDSVSVLTDRQLAEDLDALLRHADRHLRMVLVGRWDPPLPLYRYRLNGTLSEIRGDDLAFTVTETATLLAGHAIDLPVWAVTSLVERTDGWAAGLRLFAMAMEGRADAEDLVATIAGDDASIAEYFLGEVLAAQPVQIREFLLRTSIVDEFTVELAEALIVRGDARQIIDGLERANAFVQPVALRSTVHRYNRLFRELLRAQLSYEDPRLASELHRRVAAWYAASGQVATAAQHAAAAGDWQHACALVVQDLAIGRLLAGEDGDRLGGLFQAMPADPDGAETALVRAARELATAEPGHLDRIIRLPAGDAVSDQDVPVRLTTALLGALAAALRHDASAMPLAEAAESLLALACPERVAAHPELRTIILLARGTAQADAGLLGEAIAALSEAAAGPWPAGSDRLRLVCLEHLALAYAFQGRLREAGDAAARAAHLDKRRHRTSAPQSAAVCAVLAWVATERWVVAVAWRHLRAAEAVLVVGDGPMTAAAVALVRSRLLSGRGELRAAARALNLVQTDEHLDMPAWLRERIMLGEARLAVARGSADEALAAVPAVTAMASAEAAVVSAAACIAAGDAERAYEVIRPITATIDLPVPLLIEAWLIVAISAGERGAAGTAREALRQALALADADGHRRAFHQAGPWLRHLLRNDAELAAAYQTLGACPGPKARVRAVVGPAAVPAPVVIDPLSERELEVLTHLAAMLGTEEIADAMYLSVNTVKTHVRSILRKLAVSRRNEAVRRARELGLV